MNPSQAMNELDQQFAHLWMVRTFLKHSEEAEEDEELHEVHRDLYAVMLSLGDPLSKGDADAYLRQLRKKRNKLRAAVDLFLEIQPEISLHMNFRMAAQSLQTAHSKIEAILQQTDP